MASTPVTALENLDLPYSRAMATASSSVSSSPTPKPSFAPDSAKFLLSKTTFASSAKPKRFPKL